MIKKIFAYYKIPLLISLTVGITIIAMAVIRDPWEIVQVAIAVLLGSFILDTEYILYSYIFEPKSEFGKSLFGYLKYKDYGGLLGFINEHKHEVKDKSLNSVLFQVVLVPLSIFVIYSAASFFIKSLILSTYAISIYRLIEAYFEGKTKDWFWAIKGTPKKEGVWALTAVLIMILVFCLRMI